MTESQKKQVLETISMIQFTLDALQAKKNIGSWGCGPKSYEQGAWDPKKKKTFSDYYKSVIRFMNMKDKSAFKFGFTLLCFVQNPLNTHQIELMRKEYVAKGPFFHILDFVNYDEIMKDLDLLASIVAVLDLRNFPANPNIDGSTGPGKKALLSVN